MTTLNLLKQQPLLSSSFMFCNNNNLIPATEFSFKFIKHFKKQKKLTIRFAITKSEGFSKSNDPNFQIKTALQELADSFVLPPDYLKKLPRDLRLDLNDAAFDLSNGHVIDEFDQEMRETLLNIAQAWELADTSTSTTLMGKLPLLADSMTGNSKSAFGKRLVSAGRRFQSMGQYGQGELQRIAKAMIISGNLLAASPVSAEIFEEQKLDVKVFKFGELQVAITPEKAYIGAVVALVFGIVSWELSQGIQNIPESSLQYANDNALKLAKSLRGALLAMCYSSTVLSACSTVGLVLLGRQLGSKEK